MIKKIFFLFLGIIFVVACVCIGKSILNNKEISLLTNEKINLPLKNINIDKNYTSKNEVASYIMIYKKLPKNFITKKEAMKLGWIPKNHNLWDVAPGKSIGGDKFRNFEEKLPRDKTYQECDIDYEGGKRNAKRLVFSKNGAIYYTEDHYKNFEKISDFEK